MERRRFPHKKDEERARATRKAHEQAMGGCQWVAARLRELRVAAGLSRYKLAQVAGISRDMLGRIEAGVSIPTLYVLIKMLTAVGIPARWVKALLGPHRGGQKASDISD